MLTTWASETGSNHKEKNGNKMKCQTSGSTHFTKYKKLGNMFLGLLFEEVCSKGNGEFWVQVYV
jgi:hypothetical protein